MAKVREQRQWQSSQHDRLITAHRRADIGQNRDDGSLHDGYALGAGGHHLSFLGRPVRGVDQVVPKLKAVE